MFVVCVDTTRRFPVPLLLLSPLFLSSPGPCFQRASSLLLFPLMVQNHRCFLGSPSAFLAQYSQLGFSSPQIGKAAKQRAAATLWRGMILPVYTSLLLPPLCGSDSLCLYRQSLLSCSSCLLSFSCLFPWSCGGKLGVCGICTSLTDSRITQREMTPALSLSLSLDSTPSLLLPPPPLSSLPPLSLHFPPSHLPSCCSNTEPE